MAQFVAFYPRYWSGTASQTPAPSGAFSAPLSPDPGPGEQWQVIGEYAALSDAYTAADAAAGTYEVNIFDQDNQARLYANSPALAALVAAGPIADASMRSLTTRMNSSQYLNWERRRIELEVWAQVVTRNDGNGGALNPFGATVTLNFFAYPTGLPAWLAILRAATIRSRTSGQTGSTVAAEYAGWYGDSSQSPAHWTNWPGLGG